MIPLVSGFFEPLTECIPIGIYAAWSLYHFLGINPYIFFSVHIVAWLVSDYLLLRMVQVGHSMLNLQTPNKNQGCLFYYKVSTLCGEKSSYKIDGLQFLQKV
jgi:hypothetical protein